MRNLALVFAFTTSVAAFSSISLAQTVPPPNNKWSAWMEVGGHASSDRSRTEAALWLPIAQSSRSLFFADLRGKLFDDDQREGNFALGYRQMATSGWNYGGWLGFDRRQTAFGSLFSQVAFGVEAVNSSWEVRANAYLPVTLDHVLSQNQSTASVTNVGAPNLELRGGNLLLVRDSVVTSTTLMTLSKELALRGLDAEVGYKLPSFDAQAGTNASLAPELRLYAGAFVFDHNDLDRIIAGPKLRAEWRVNNFVPSWEGSRLTVEGQYRWDELRGAQQEVGLKLRLPFGEAGTRSRSLSTQERLMAEAVHRDTDIVTQKKTTSFSTSTTTNSQSTEQVADAQTGVVFDRATIVSNGSNLQSAITLAGSNSLLIAQGGATNFGQITLANAQTLMGAGSTLEVRGITSGFLASYTPAGLRPTINYTGNSAVVTLASNVHLLGIDITGGGGRFAPVPLNGGITGDSLSNVVVQSVSVRNTGDTGIALGGNGSNIVVRDSVIDNVGGDGLNAQFNNNGILISNNDVTNTRFDGIIFQGSNLNVRVLDNRLANIGDDAIGGMGNNTIEYSRNRFSGAIAENLLDIFLTNGNRYSGSGNILSPGLTVGGRLCEASPGPTFTGSFSFTDGTVFQDNVAPCN